MFAKNVGPLDRAIRLVVGVVFLSVGVFVLGAAQGSVAGLAASTVGVIGLVTGATGRCPMYVPLGISTRKVTS